MTESIEARLAILGRMVERLDDYLDDDQLYKTITVYPPEGERLVKLTIGAMLEHFDALRDRDDLTSAQRERFVELERTVGRLKEQRDEAYYSKLAQELKSYTDSWRWFLQTCEDGDRQCETEYPHEVKTRLRRTPPRRTTRPPAARRMVAGRICAP